ncbi:class I SAM-dependent methyltransferase [Saccharopolyspora gloriosae]|uniref:class I SAM-dependent methyltransferase n=1 Tax=Saccharopolyspora gloriosae TaxID=455344 RepID=UPI001FB7B682|nr:class I SAM-dependent methyltransferase [Saccharopolyspora gloriosae]
MHNNTSTVSTTDVAGEWRQRSRRDGLARVMRASQPAEHNAATTERTRDAVSAGLRTAARELARPLSTVLEIGCGIGRLTPTLAAHAGRVTALDMTPGMLDEARASCAHLSNVDFEFARAEDLPWEGRKIDVAVSVWVLMHVLDEAALAEICRSISRSCRYFVLVEYAQAAIPVSEWSRLRSVDDYLALMPGARLVESQELYYGGDLSTAALIRFPG